MRKLFRKRVDEAPPLEGIWQVPPRFNYTRDVIEAYAADPLYPALTYVDRNGVIDRRTFTEIAREANRWAALLRNRGLQPGDRLLVFTAKTPTWVAILLGALKAGMVAVPCSEGVQTGELAWRAEDSGARLIVTDRERAAAVALMDVPLNVVVAEEAATELRKTPILQPTHDTAAEDAAVILYTSKAGVQIGRHPHSRLDLGSTGSCRALARGTFRRRRLVHRGAGRCGVRLEPPPRAVGMRRRARDPRGLLRPRPNASIFCNGSASRSCARRPTSTGSSPMPPRPAPSSPADSGTRSRWESRATRKRPTRSRMRSGSPSGTASGKPRTPFSSRTRGAPRSAPARSGSRPPVTRWP